jgi:hypothetical protein
MSFAGGLLMILTGLAIMAFGLFLFYAWLPLLYGLIGFDIGLLLGRWLTGDVGTLAIVLGIIGAIILAVASYSLEPYRRVLLGVSGGVLLGLALTALFGWASWVGGLFGLILAAVLGLIGGIIVPLYFDLFVVAASALSGAAIVMAGAHLLLPGVGLFDHSSGALLPRLLTLVLAVVGMGWQMTNIEKWVQSEPFFGDRRPLP